MKGSAFWQVGQIFKYKQSTRINYKNHWTYKHAIKKAEALKIFITLSIMTVYQYTLFSSISSLFIGCKIIKEEKNVAFLFVTEEEFPGM